MSRASMSLSTSALVAALAVATLAGAHASLRGASADGPVVDTADGPLRGAVEGAAHAFRGVPFAAPPVGALRWADPAPVTPWTETRDATQWTKGCPQICDMPPGTCPDQWAEDCLYLNVFRPANAAAGAKLPVMFWIPGGRYLQGAAGMPLYDGSTLATEQNIIVVTTDYRLGALGFAVVGGKGSWGIRDQIAALKWVQTNIAAFGGDPAAVTIAGQSAGGCSVGTLLVTPLAKGLFSRAIMESNPMSLRLKEGGEDSTTADKLATGMGCKDGNDLDCLRAVDVNKLMQAAGDAQGHFFLSHPLDMFLPWSPYVGGDVLPDQPITLIKNNRGVNAVPLMLGNMKNDAWMFVYSALGSKLTQVEYRALITYIFGLSRESKLEDLYTTGSIFKRNDTRPALSLLGTDYIFRCPNRLVADTWRAQFPSMPAYVYQFNHAPSSGNTWGANFSFCAGVACHGSEIPFLFASFDAFPGATSTPAEDALGKTLRAYWGSFIRGEAPSAPGAAAWPQWTGTPGSADGGSTMLLDVAGKAGVTTALHSQACDWWDEQGYTFG
uniref:Carboxylic ester hydrolase n=1 Tax=Bicosoecida sp. CB-2014 TaxID=1486930 RepID=A0A7S1GE85_9STRA